MKDQGGAHLHCLRGGDGAWTGVGTAEVRAGRDSGCFAGSTVRKHRPGLSPEGLSASAPNLRAAHPPASEP